MNRSTDNQVDVHFRADRFCRISGEWYYSMREQDGLGPFPTRESAKEDLDLQLSAVEQSPTERVEVQCGSG